MKKGRGETGRLGRFFRWWFKGTWLQKNIKLLLALILLYNAYACATLIRPPIHGVVVNAATGRPIAGAEVFAAARFSILIPVETADRQRGGGGYGITDGKGRFSLPVRSCAWWFPSKGEVAPWIPALFIPKWMNRIEVHVYDKNYITENIQSPPWFWRPYFVYSNGSTQFHRWRFPILGYYFKVALYAPKDEAAWEQKCDNTVRSAQLVPEEIAQRWLFNDLTGYLERWPHGEKAGGYILSLADTGIAMYEPFWNEPISDPVKLKKYLSTEQQILKWMKSKPVQRITKNPLYQKIWSDKLQIISDSIAQMEKQGAVTKDGGKDAN